MSVYEFKIVPVPRKTPGLALFRNDAAAMTLPAAINALAGDGWTFVRTDRLPVPARSRPFPGLPLRRDVLVFRRPRTKQMRRALGPERQSAGNPAAFVRDAKEFAEGIGPLGLARAA